MSLHIVIISGMKDEVAAGLPHTGRTLSFTKSAPTVSVPFEVLVNRESKKAYQNYSRFLNSRSIG